MEKFKIIATTNFGLEALCKRELLDLGYNDLKVQDGRIELTGTYKDVCALNLNLRTAERIFMVVASFEALSFEELFDKVYDIDWTYFLNEDSNFILLAKSHKSKLFSLSDIQRISEKAIIKKLQNKYKKDWFSKSNERIKIEVSLLDDIATIAIDTSGDGLHKRGYRQINYKAPISETIAASMVMLSFWNPERPLADPFCGSGTIVIEAAMIGKNIAPGLMRKFDLENFIFIPQEIFKEEKRKCYEKIDYDKKLNINASDVSYKAIEVAKNNSAILDLDEDINFFQKDIRNLDLEDNYGVLITNPPYGERLAVKEAPELNRELGRLYKTIPTWSLYAITGSETFQKDFGKKADRKRKLYNGKIKTYYFQYYGPRPFVKKW